MLSAKKQILVSEHVSPLEEDAPYAYQGGGLEIGEQTSIQGSNPGDSAKPQAGHVREGRQTLLSVFVRERLSELGMRQSEFCRMTGFDQGLLSKIQSSLITNLSLESVLRLSIGLSVSPQQILALIDRGDLQKLMRTAYPLMVLSQAEIREREIPVPVLKVNQLAMKAYELGRSLAPVIGVLAHLTTCPEERTESGTPGDAFRKQGRSR